MKIENIRRLVKTPAVNYPRTRAHVVGQIPDCGLTLKQAEKVATALMAHWQEAIRHTENEVLTSGCVWDASAQKLRDVKF